MANHKSAIKKTRRDLRRRNINKPNRSRMRTAIKKIRGLISEGKIEEARKIYPEVSAVIDHSRTKGIIHRNTASRYKSRLHKALTKAS